MWVARDKNSNLRWFETKPGRDWGNYDDYLRNELTVWKDGVIENYEHILPNNLFTELTWDDEPIEIELVPKMMNAVQEKLAKSVDDYFDYVGHVQDIHPYSKEREQNYYNDMCWRWQDWNAIKYDHPSTWDLNFDDYVGSKR